MSDTTQAAAGRGLRGQAVTLADGQQYVVPSFNFAQLEQFEAQLATLPPPIAGMKPEQRDTLLTIFHAALVRNYPAVTKDQLGELIDLEAAMDLYLAIFSVNKLRELLGRMGAASP